MTNAAAETDLKIAVPYQIDLAGISTPRLDDYFGVWAILEEPFRQACRVVEGMDLKEHIAATGPTRLEKLEARREEAPVISASGKSSGANQKIAVISLTGPLMKQTSSLSGGTSTVAFRQAVRQAAADPEIASIAIRIDSPGGTAAGTAEAAAEVAAAAKKKPVWAYIEDLGASAAYWIASQASRISVNPTGMVGSIGTFMVMHDLSQLAAKEGVKVHVIRAGSFKGAGTPGTEITQEQLDHFQGIVNSLNDHFLSAVAARRSVPLKQVREIADGRVHIGDAAKSLGLVDAAETFDATLQALSKERKGSTMTESNNQTQASTPAAPQPASYQDLVAGCGGLDPQNGEDAKWIASQLAAGATLPQAQQAWGKYQKDRFDASQKELAELKAKQSAPPAGGNGNTAASRKSGVDPITSNAAGPESETADPTASIDQLVSQEMQARNIPRNEAFRRVMRNNPSLRGRLVDSANG